MLCESSDHTLSKYFNCVRLSGHVCRPLTFFCFIIKKAPHLCVLVCPTASKSISLYNHESFSNILVGDQKHAIGKIYSVWQSVK